MKISVLSDIHIDFWCSKPGILCKRLEKTLGYYLDDSKDVEVLVIAGDLSHYNIDMKVIEKIAEIWNYKKIFCTLGNHDLYLVSGQQKKKYKKDSVNRYQEFLDYKDPKNIVHVLDGDIIEYKGVKFGGAMSWYDGSYMRNPMMYGTSEIQQWKETMNDARLIYKMGDFYDIFSKEIPKVSKIIDADVIITHFCPLSAPMAFQEQYKYQKSSKFYAFDGEKYLEETNAKYWIYGHSHGHHEFEIYDTKCIMNALGYPMEFCNTEKTIIEV